MTKKFKVKNDKKNHRSLLKKKRLVEKMRLGFRTYLKAYLTYHPKKYSNNMHFYFRSVIRKEAIISYLNKNVTSLHLCSPSFIFNFFKDLLNVKIYFSFFPFFFFHVWEDKMEVLVGFFFSLSCYKKS